MNSAAAAPNGSYAIPDELRAAPAALPAPPPSRIHWATLLMVTGLVICVLGILATVAGIPARIGYDVDGPPDRNEPTGNPLHLSESIDGNMKWMSQATSDEPGSYLSTIKTVNRNEMLIAPMVQSVVAMDAAVRGIETGVSGVRETTSGMRTDLDAMAASSARTAETMQQLGDDVGALSSSMQTLSAATLQLGAQMKDIEQQAASIASDHTSAALATTKQLNQSLPTDAPEPVLAAGGQAAAPAAAPAAGQPAQPAPPSGGAP